MKKTSALILALIALLSLCACGSAKSESAAYTASYAVEAPAEMPAVTMDEMDFGGFSASAVSGSEEAPARENNELSPEKIIYSGNATVETTDFDTAIEGLNALVSKFGGFIEQSSVNGSNYYSISRGYAASRSAYYTIRIPSESFRTIMNELSTLGNVPYSHVYTTNITSEYYDTAARLKSYQVQEETLLALLEKAESIEDVLAVQSELSNVRYRIESLQSTLKNWDRQVSYSSIDVEISEVREYTPEAKMSYGERLANAFRSGMVGFWDFLKDTLIWFAESLPALVILALVVFFGTKGIKKSIKKRREKKAEKAEKAE